MVDVVVVIVVVTEILINDMVVATFVVISHMSGVHISLGTGLSAGSAVDYFTACHWEGVL